MNTKPIIQLIRQQASLTPDNIALVYETTSYTYRDVIAQASTITRQIIKKGLGKEDVVGILIPRNQWMAIAPVGVLAANCAYMPMDPTYPAERLNFMLSDSQAKMLIADKEVLSDSGLTVADGYVMTEAGKVPVLYIENLQQMQADSSPSFGEGVEGDALALLIYTSGSTGKPKGCMIEQRNISCTAEETRSALSLDSASRVASYASFSFVPTVHDIFGTLSTGGTLYIIPEEIRFDFVRLAQYLDDNAITHIIMSTMTGREFVTMFHCPSLRYLSVGGEKLNPVTPASGLTFLNIYGSSEACGMITCHAVRGGEDNIPIGKAPGTFRLYIVGEDGQQVADGEAGELWISGPQLCRGYLNHPELTANVFIHNPFRDNQEEGYERVFRTGDFVRRDAEGNLLFAGRRDGLVKIRGFRVELREVESAVLTYPGVTGVTVQSASDQQNGTYIVAYVTGENELDGESIRQHVAAQKPAYMVPELVMQIEEIPRNNNGKVDCGRLPKPVRSVAAESQQTEQAPMNVLEKELHEIISKLVGNSDFGITTLLGHAGLTSITAMKLAVEVNKRYGIELDAKSLAKTVTLQSIENEIYRSLMDDGKSKTENTKTQPSATSHLTSAPLNYAQLGVYYECMKHPLDTTYNLPTVITLPSGIDADKVEQTLIQIVTAHPAFNIHFETQGDDVVQVYDPDMVPQIGRREMTEAELATYQQHFTLPFHLDRGPLYRMEIVQTEERVGILMDVHHLIFDGASFDLVVCQLCDALDGKTIEGERLGFLQFSQEQRQAESGPAYQEAKAYFAEVMKMCEGCTELTDDFTPSEPHGHVAQVARPFDYTKVEQFCKSQNVTPASLMLAVSFYTLSRYTNSRHVYISTISNGRSDLRLADTTGMFVNTLPLAGHITEQTVEEFVRRTSQNFEQTMRHEQYPFARIAADFDFSANTTYSYQLGVIEEHTIGGEKITIKTIDVDVPKQKLDIIIIQQNGQPVVCLEYDDAFYSAKTMEGLAESFISVLEHFMETPKGSLLKVSMLSDEQERLVNSFRMAGTADVPTRLFHQAVEANAEQKPDAKALVACDGTFTFSQVNAEMNRVANALIAHGVKRGDRVAMLLPRTSRLIFTMFGIMKAGAAYIPCDPHYPADRIKLILEDSEAAYIVTDDENLANLKEQAGEGSLKVLEKALNVEELLQCENTANPAIPQESSDLAYIIYTSGSTGRPKGVMLHHKGICNELFAHPLNFRNWTVMQEVKCILGLATISFDASVEEIGIPLYNGLTLALASDEITNDPILLAEFMMENQVGMFQGTPSRLMQLYESDVFRKALSGCHIIELGGEKFSDSQLRELQKTMVNADSSTNVHIFNSFGPTETTVESNSHEVTHEDHVTIGRPLVNVTEYIVDADMNRVPVGVVGELLIGGAQVGLGYNNLPDKTREAFIPNPFAIEGSFVDNVLYRSGDYARWDEHGYVSILGRTDNQVKLRGLRIELGEIESVIAQQEGIGQVVVMIRKLNGKEHLCAYFTANHPVDIDELKVEISKSLTQYMVPTAYLQLDKMPTTPSGKTDMKALPEPTLSITTEYVAPVGEFEKQLCDIFANILQVERVGATDNFFELGGTSLLVTRVIIEADKAGYHVAYGDLFTNPTPRMLAEFVSGEAPVDDVDHEVTDFDYKGIDAILQQNNVETFLQGERQQLGHVLLTGATGYLGIHVLRELIDSDATTITCLVRGKDQKDAERRVRNLLFYYFETSYKELFGSRLFVVNGDVTQDIKVETPIDTVFNCAANVKHFSKGTDIEDVNIGGARHCVDFCLKTGARLVHVSTTSIADILIDRGDVSRIPSLNERMLWFGQFLDNRYIHSKFLAERLVLDAVARHGLSAKIMRVGNLAPRSYDGEFQANFNSNSFMGQLKVFYMLGCCPYDNYDDLTEMSPIDQAAKAVVLLASTPKACTVFHPYNNHTELLGDVIKLMTKLGKEVRFVEADEFAQTVDAAGQDPEKAKLLSAFLAYQDVTHGQKAFVIEHDNRFTCSVLHRLGFHWKDTSWDYVERMLAAIGGFGFFED